MTLEELISALTTAQENTDCQEEWTHGDFEIHAGMYLRAKFQFRGEAEASAIQHNTAGAVFEELKRHRDLQGASGFWGRAAAKATNERDEWKDRAEKLVNDLEISRGTAEVAAENTELAEQLTAIQRDRAEKAEAKVTELEKVESTYHELRNALFEMTHETDSRTIDELVNGDLAIAAAVALMKWPDQSGSDGS